MNGREQKGARGKWGRSNGEREEKHLKTEEREGKEKINGKKKKEFQR